MGVDPLQSKKVQIKDFCALLEKVDSRLFWMCF
jgi:hypothetical protein